MKNGLKDLSPHLEKILENSLSKEELKKEEVDSKKEEYSKYLKERYEFHLNQTKGNLFIKKNHIFSLHMAMIEARKQHFKK